MKKLLISILLLLAASAVQIKSYFARGAAYKNEKTGQIILLFSDLHFKRPDSTKLQRKQLISELKKLDQTSCITLVEDSNSDKVNIGNKKYQSTIKFLKESELNSGFNIKSASPLVLLHSDLIENTINTENIECRYMELHSFDKPNPFLSSNITIKDVLSEIKQNIKNLENQSREILKYKNNYDKKDFDYISSYFQEVLYLVSKSPCEYISALENITKNIPEVQNQNQLRQEHFIATEQFKKLKTKNNTNLNIINTNILNEILKNHDKKTIIICAGAIHTQVIECFISEIGYKQIKQIGIDAIPPTDYTKFEEIATNPPSPIYVTELFTNITIQDQQPDYSYNLQTPKDKMLKRKIASFSEYEQNKSLTNICEILQLNRKPVQMAKIFETLENKKYKNKNQYSSLESFENNTSKLSTKNTRLETNIGKINENISFETVYQDEPTKLFNICYKDKESGFATDLAKKVECLTSYLNYHKHEITLNL